MSSTSLPLAGHRLALVRSVRVAELDDAALARSLIEGEAGAPAAVWDRYAVVVRGLLRRALGPGGDIEDLVQETFLLFFRQIKGIRDPAALRPFLIGIATRVARYDLRRRRLRRWIFLTDDGVLPEEAREGTAPEVRQALQRFYQLLDRLDDKARLLFALRNIQGLELAEAAVAVGVSVATAKRHLAKVTARLHAMAEGDPVLSAYLDAVPEGTQGD
ncbi:RNA polymerase sigma factor [Sorangium sp. So ce1151]|uniref:RNA polymerase sigma factor n=1 Tax=Sorangium sp. So ce1151 TaxID=3133332 RepID=UPI003F6184DF